MKVSRLYVSITVYKYTNVCYIVYIALDCAPMSILMGQKQERKKSRLQIQRA